jgi:hypothetical protein
MLRAACLQIQVHPESLLDNRGKLLIALDGVQVHPFLVGYRSGLRLRNLITVTTPPGIGSVFNRANI